jgi:hypothetical protein
MEVAPGLQFPQRPSVHVFDNVRNPIVIRDAIVGGSVHAAAIDANNGELMFVRCL